MTAAVPGGLTTSPMRSASHPRLSVVKPLVAGTSHHVKDMTFVKAGGSAGVVAFCPCGLGRRLGRPKLSSHHDVHRPAQLDLTHRPSSMRHPPAVDETTSMRFCVEYPPRDASPMDTRFCSRASPPTSSTRLPLSPRTEWTALASPPDTFLPRVIPVGLFSGLLPVGCPVALGPMNTLSPTQYRHTPCMIRRRRFHSR